MLYGGQRASALLSTWLGAENDAMNVAYEAAVLEPDLTKLHVHRVHRWVHDWGSHFGGVEPDLN